ncbi:MAG: NTP transferase domain-containing protein [Hormoscilla sp.]
MGVVKNSWYVGTINVMMISAIVLAAGESTRMGQQNKLLLPFRGQTLIERTVDTVLQSDVGEVIVVLGYDAERVRAVLADRPVKFRQNESYQKGMTTSIQSGVEAADDRTDGFMICLSDLPLIEADELNHLVQAFEEAVKVKPFGIVMPVFEGQRGNPVILSALYKHDILAHQDMQGCKGIIQQNLENVREVEMNTDGVLRDMDTLEDYHKLCQILSD